MGFEDGGEVVLEGEDEATVGTVAEDLHAEEAVDGTVVGDREDGMDLSLEGVDSGLRVRGDGLVVDVKGDEDDDSVDLPFVDAGIGGGRDEAFGAKPVVEDGVPFSRGLVDSVEGLEKADDFGLWDPAPFRSLEIDILLEIPVEKGSLDVDRVAVVVQLVDESKELANSVLVNDRSVDVNEVDSRDLAATVGDPASSVSREKTGRGVDLLRADPGRAKDSHPTLAIHDPKDPLALEYVELLRKRRFPPVSPLFRCCSLLVGSRDLFSRVSGGAAGVSGVVEGGAKGREVSGSVGKHDVGVVVEEIHGIGRGGKIGEVWDFWEGEREVGRVWRERRPGVEVEVVRRGGGGRGAGGGGGFRGRWTVVVDWRWRRKCDR